MKDIVIEFIGSQWFVYSMWIYLFLCLMYIVYSIFNYFKYYSKMKNKLSVLYAQMGEQERARAEAERRERDIHGAGIKKDWLQKLDEELAYSGIKDKLKWLTTEIFVTVVGVTDVVVSTIVLTLAGPLNGIITFALIIAFFKLLIVFTSNARDKRTEEQLLQFMNIIDNFSKTSDDLVDILEKASRYIQDPLSSQIYEAVQEARNSGDRYIALQDLMDSSKNKHFKLLIRNLETSSRYENNYSDIIEDCRTIFHDYIRAQKEKRSIRYSGIIEILMMVGTGFMCLSMIGQMTDEGSVIDMLLNNGTAGMILFWAIVASMLISLYIAVFQILRTD